MVSYMVRMGGKFRKRYRKIVDSPRDVRRNDLIWVLERVGFQIAGGKGSHVVMKHPDVVDMLTLPDQNPLKIAYVRKSLQLIDEVYESEEE